jgi:hypothetical protein
MTVSTKHDIQTCWTMTHVPVARVVRERVENGEIRVGFSVMEVGAENAGGGITGADSPGKMAPRFTDKGFGWVKVGGWTELEILLWPDGGKSIWGIGADFADSDVFTAWSES